MLRAQALTNKARPGGRPRASRAPRNAFADWLAKCDLSPEDVAKKLGVSISSIYNARNGYYKPGRDLAIKIQELATPDGGGESAVPVESWSKSKIRARAPKK